MCLRGRDKIKFKKYKRTDEKYIKSQLCCGITLWDRLLEKVVDNKVQIQEMYPKNASLTLVSDQKELL